MDRAPQHPTAPPRRLMTGVALVMAATAALIATAWASPATSGRAGERPFPNLSGVLAVVGTNGAEAENPFFQNLGTNGAVRHVTVPRKDGRSPPRSCTTVSTAATGSIRSSAPTTAPTARAPTS